MERYDRIIAIDPDVDKSGVAEFNLYSKKMEATTLCFPDLTDYLRHVRQNFAGKGEKVAVIVEAGWMNATNWHTGRVRSIAAAAKTGQNTGRNHETARKIAEMSRHYGLETIEVKPLRKCWKGRDGKITHDELNGMLEASGITPMAGRTNQEMRDAVLLAVFHSGIPVRMNLNESGRRKI